MMRMQVSWETVKYDKRHDVLHVFLGNGCLGFAEEEYPGVFVKKCEDTEEIVGLTIMDFNKRRDELSKVKVLSEYEFVL